VQLTLVDAVRAGRRDWLNELERVQLRTATHVFVSRRDVVSEERWREVEGLVRTTAPRTRWTDVQAFAAELDDIEQEVALQPARDAPADTGHVHAAGHSRYHFASLELALPGRADPDRFLAFLRALPATVLRAKGIVDLGPPVEGKRTFQKVDGDVAISDCELYEPETLPTTAVFIGVQLPAAELRDAVAALF
jgi:G3E family GTPase